MTKGELTQLRIIQSAMKLIGKKGFVETTLEEIAKDAKVQRQGVINYFGGKSGLFRACVLQILTEFAKVYEERSKPHYSAADLLNLQFKLNLEMATQQSERARLVLFLYLHAAHEPELQEIYQESIVRIRRRYHVIVEAGIREGKIKPTANPDLLGAIFHELIVGMIINLLAHRGKASEVTAVSKKWKMVTESFWVD